MKRIRTVFAPVDDLRTDVDAFIGLEGGRLWKVA